MGKVVGISVLTLVFATAVVAGESSVTCEILDDGTEKIQCTLVTPRKNEARETTFYWHSEAYPQDDRERQLSLPANHGSVYDYRYLRGRAQGDWKITVTLTDADGSETETTCRFQLQDDKIVQADK